MEPDPVRVTPGWPRDRLDADADGLAWPFDEQIACVSTAKPPEDRIITLGDLAIDDNRDTVAAIPNWTR